MKRKFLALSLSFFILTLSTVFAGVFSLKKAKATPSWYATFAYKEKVYAFSHAFKKTDWNTIIPGFPNSINSDPDGNAGDKGQNWCNNTLITDGEDNNYDDWFVPNRSELEAALYYEGNNPWDLPAYMGEVNLWSSSTNPFIGRWHRAASSGRNDDKVTPYHYARCVRIISGPSPTPTATPSPTPSPTPPPVSFKFLLLNWGTSNPDADLNSDGLVNGLDFGKMIRLLK